MTYYTCSLRGECEPDNYSSQTLEECSATCRSLEGGEDVLEAAYLTMTYNLDQALEAAPSDRVHVIRRLTGVTVQPEESWRVLEAISNQDYLALYHYPHGMVPFADERRRWPEKHRKMWLERYDAFDTFLQEKEGLDEFDFLILEAQDESIYPIPNWSAIRRRTEREFIQAFAGRDPDLRERLTDGDGIKSLEDLTSYLQAYLAVLIEYNTYSAGRCIGNEEVERLIVSHWLYLQQRFGSFIPHQDLIGMEPSDD